VEGLQYLMEKGYVGLPDEEYYETEELANIEDERVSPEALEKIVSSTQLAYERGDISSMITESLLGRYILVDKDGRIWTIGLRSGAWYYYLDDDWVKSDKKPKTDTLLRLKAPPDDCAQCGHSLDGGYVCPSCGAELKVDLGGVSDDVFVKFFGFLSLGFGTLPESVTDVWDPPTGFPEILEERSIPCVECGETAPAGSRFCNHCGAELRCPNCGAKNLPDSRYCNQCGGSLFSSG